MRYLPASRATDLPLFWESTVTISRKIRLEMIRGERFFFYCRRNASRLRMEGVAGMEERYKII